MKLKTLLIGFLVSSLTLVLAQDSLETITSEGKTVGSIDWSAAGKIEAIGFGVGAANASVEAQKKVTARRAAIADAQRQLLEIIKGVSVYNGVLTSDRMLANDTVVTQVQGVLRGAVIVEGSEKWDADAGLYELTMTIALADLRDAVEPSDMKATLDIENLIMLGSSVTQALPETSEATQATDSSQDTSQTPTQTSPFAANNDSFEVAQGGTVSQNVLSNDSNLPQGVQVTLVGNVSHGTLALNTDGTFIYTNNGSANATDVFKYTISDGATTVEAFTTLSIALAPQATPETSVTTTETSTATTTPTATPDTYTTNQGGTLEVSAAEGVLRNDSSPSGQPLIVVSNGSPSHGTLTLYPNDGSFRYTHDGSASSSDSFVYTAKDSTGNSNETTVTITFTPGIQAQTPAQQTPADQAPADQASPQPSTTAPVVEGDVAVSAPASASASPSTPSSGVGGDANEVVVQAPVEVATGDLPSGIVLDASSYPVKKSFFMTVYSSSGEILRDKVKASYLTSLEAAKHHEDVAATPEVMPVFAVSPNNVDVVLSDEAAGRFKSLFAAQEFNILIVRQE